MARDRYRRRSRSRSRSSSGSVEKARKRRSRSRDRDRRARDRDRRSRTPERFRRSRSRERRRSRSRSRDRDRDRRRRSRSRGRDRRSRSRDRNRSRSRDRRDRSRDRRGSSRDRSSRKEKEDKKKEEENKAVEDLGELKFDLLDKEAQNKQLELEMQRRRERIEKWRAERKKKEIAEGATNASNVVVPSIKKWSLEDDDDEDIPAPDAEKNDQEEKPEKKEIKEEEKEMEVVADDDVDPLDAFMQGAESKSSSKSRNEIVVEEDKVSPKTKCQTDLNNAETVDLTSSHKSSKKALQGDSILSEGQKKPPKKIPPPSFHSEKVSKVGDGKNVPNQFEFSVTEVHDISELTTPDTEDQYDKFGKHIAAQLRELPLRNFIILQDKIQNLISIERLSYLDLQRSTLPSSDNDLNPQQSLNSNDMLQQEMNNFPQALLGIGPDPDRRPKFNV